jgi:hypothetical protein
MTSSSERSHRNRVTVSHGHLATLDVPHDEIERPRPLPDLHFLDPFFRKRLDERPLLRVLVDLAGAGSQVRVTRKGPWVAPSAGPGTRRMLPLIVEV